MRGTMLDLACSLGLLGVIIVAGVLYAVRHALVGAPHFSRVDRDGGSALLGQGPMNAGYWALQPLGALCIRARISPDTITLASLGLGIVAGVALAFGHFGVAALAASIGALGDALDGLVARATGLASNAGEVLDAVVDRYQEFAFLAGVAVYYRAELPWLALALLALLGAFMTSYASAKAEALGIGAPRGTMRRAERAVYLLAAFVLTPVAMAVCAHFGWPARAAHLPMLLALALVGVVANVSAIRRYAFMMSALRARDAARRGQPLPADCARSSQPSLWRVFGRHQLGSVVATVVDFGAMVGAVEYAHVNPAWAAALGAAVGAATNFTLGRHWIFKSTAEHPTRQAVRYAVVSGASLLLNALGEYALAVHAGAPYVLARAAVALAVGVLWNFPMQRLFVFPASSEKAT